MNILFTAVLTLALLPVGVPAMQQIQETPTPTWAHFAYVEAFPKVNHDTRKIYSAKKPKTRANGVTYVWEGPTGVRTAYQLNDGNWKLVTL